jgi:hypothetical protein
MKVIQYRHTFIDSPHPLWEGEVDSVTQLTALPFVQRFWATPGFTRFSVARGDYPAVAIILMAEYRDGEQAYVVALISGPDALGRLRALPEWVPKEDPVRQVAFKPVVTDPLGPPLDE